jgi:hypothetical protein
VFDANSVEILIGVISDDFRNAHPPSFDDAFCLFIFLAETARSKVSQHFDRFSFAVAPIRDRRCATPLIKKGRRWCKSPVPSRGVTIDCDKFN